MNYTSHDYYVRIACFVFLNILVLPVVSEQCASPCREASDLQAYQDLRE